MIFEIINRCNKVIKFFKHVQPNFKKTWSIVAKMKQQEKFFLSNLPTKTLVSCFFTYFAFADLQEIFYIEAKEDAEYEPIQS